MVKEKEQNPVFMDSDNSGEKIINRKNDSYSLRVFCACFFVFCFSFFSHTHSIWKVPGHGTPLIVGFFVFCFFLSFCLF